MNNFHTAAILQEVQEKCTGIELRRERDGWRCLIKMPQDTSGMGFDKTVVDAIDSAISACEVEQSLREDGR